MIEAFPFTDEQYFETAVFEQNYDVLVYSLLMDYSNDIYTWVNEDVQVPYKGYADITSMSPADTLKRFPTKDGGPINADFYRWFNTEVVYKGPISPEQFTSNLERLTTLVSKPIIFINGAEELPDNTNRFERDQSIERHKLYNALLDDFVACKNNVGLLDIRKIVTANDINDHIRHYKRHVYARMAKELSVQIGKLQDVPISKNLLAQVKASFSQLVTKLSRQTSAKIKKLTR